MRDSFHLALRCEQTSKRITIYVQPRGPGLSFADQVLRRTADCHVSGHVEHPHSWRALVEVHRVSMLTVRPAVVGGRWVSFTGADQQGSAALQNHQGVDLHHHVLRRNWRWWEEGKKKETDILVCQTQQIYENRQNQAFAHMWCADFLQWPVLWRPGGALRTWSWVSPGDWRWRTGRKVMLACGGLGGESEPQPSEPLTRSTLAPKSNGGLEGRRGSDSWRSSSGWHAAPRWLTTGRWWREPPQCLSDRRDNQDGASLVHSSVHQDSWDQIF